MLREEWLALCRSVPSGVGAKFAQSSSHWEARADTLARGMQDITV
jgi:hypothetical protein